MRKRYPEKYKEFQKYEAHTTNPYNSMITGIGYIRGFKPAANLLESVVDDNGFRKTVKDNNEPYFAGKEYHGINLFIDRRQYAKIYLEFISILIKQGLSMPGVKVLFFILKRLKTGDDTVRFTISAAKANTGYKNDKSVYEGLCELIDMAVIARKEDTEEEYFINPQFVFRGKREKLIDAGDGE